MHEIRRRRSHPPRMDGAVHWIVVLLASVAAWPVVGQAKPAVPDLSTVRSALETWRIGESLARSAA